jgi:hypothetical protein
MSRRPLRRGFRPPPEVVLDAPLDEDVAVDELAPEDALAELPVDPEVVDPEAPLELVTVVDLEAPVAPVDDVAPELPVAELVLVCELGMADEEQAATTATSGRGEKRMGSS